MLSLPCGNYNVWLQNITLYLGLAGLDSHIDTVGYMTYIPCPTVSNPAQGTEELNKDNWDANDCSVHACICLTLDNDELDHVCTLKPANKMYKALAK
jgi:hypothetical protein